MRGVNVFDGDPDQRRSLQWNGHVCRQRNNELLAVCLWRNVMQDDMRRRRGLRGDALLRGTDVYREKTPRAALYREQYVQQQHVQHGLLPLEGVHQEIAALHAVGARFIAPFGAGSWVVMNHAPSRQTVQPPQRLMNTF